MASVKSRFGPFIPDVPVFGAEGSDIVKNALPVKGGYIPARKVVPVTEAAGQDVLAARFARSSDQTSFGFVATVERIQRLVDQRFADASRPGGYQTADGENWSIVRFGDQIFFSNFSNIIQQFDLRGDVNFSDFPISTPKARYLMVVNRFLVLLYLNEAGTISSSGVRWSGLDTPTIFPAIDINTNIRSDEAVSTLSDRQILSSELGAITGGVSGVSGADAIIFQEKGITAMNFQGGEAIFSFDVLEGSRGCVAPRSIIQEGGKVFYISDTGLYVTDGSTTERVGANRVDDFIFKTVRTDRIEEIESGIDVQQKFIFWTLPGFNDVSLVYNYAIDEFAIVEDLGIGVFARTLATAPTLEGVAEQFGGLDNMDVSLDDPQFSGGSIPIFSAFDRNNRLGSLTGATLPAVLKTPEREVFDDSRAYLNFTRPLIDATDMAVTAVMRDTLQETPSPKDNVTVQEGIAVHRVTGRYVALQIEIPENADWNFAQGIQAVFEEAGNRAPELVTLTFKAPLFLLAKTEFMLLDGDGRPLVVTAQEIPPVGSRFIVTDDGDFLTTDDGLFIVTVA